MDEYVSMRCRSDQPENHQACRLSYLGVTDVTCGCLCHIPIPSAAQALAEYRNARRYL